MYQIGGRIFSPTTSKRPKTKYARPPVGVRFRNRLMHDGTSPTLRDAVLRHSGEAGEVNRAFSDVSERQGPSRIPEFSIKESVTERGTRISV